MRGIKEENFMFYEDDLIGRINSFKIQNNGGKNGETDISLLWVVAECFIEDISANPKKYGITHFKKGNFESGTKLFQVVVCGKIVDMELVLNNSSISNLTKRKSYIRFFGPEKAAEKLYMQFRLFIPTAASMMDYKLKEKLKEKEESMALDL